MSDTYGKSVTLTIFGESHGPAVGATVTGLAPGVPVDLSLIHIYSHSGTPRARCLFHCVLPSAGCARKAKAAA